MTAGLCAAVLVLTGGAAAAQAPPGATAVVAATATVEDFSQAQGWRSDRHLRTVADVDGDGRADIVGFGDTGVQVARGRADGTFSASALVLQDFGWDQGWRVDRHPRQVVDLDGDNRADIVGFGEAGVLVSYARADGTFTAAVLAVRDFGWDQGWRVERHVRRVADLSKDGRAEIVGFGDAGTFLSLAQVDGTFSPPRLQAMQFRPDFGYDQGWRVDRHVREVVQLHPAANTTVVGFGDRGLHASYFLPQGGVLSLPFLLLRNFGVDQGWLAQRHPRALVDMNGDGFRDVVGFGDAGTYLSITGSGSFPDPVLALRDFGTAQGWRTERHPRVLADVTGDGLPDVVGFGEAGVLVAPARADGTIGPASLVIGDFGAAQGWRVDQHPRELADVNGDGRADIIGFGLSRTYVQLL